MNRIVRNEVSPDRLASMLEENMGLVVKLAKSFNPRDDSELDEFVQLGRIGAWKGIERHDPSRSALSTTIWHYVRYEILRHLHKAGKINIQLDETIPIEDNGITDCNFWEYMPDSLSEKERSVIQLRIEGYSFVDIGLKLGYSRGWANNTFRTALEKIEHANKEEETPVDV